MNLSYNKIQNPEICPIFIVGVGRSGTSLVQSMLAAHADISCLPETSFLRRMIFPGRLQKIFDRYGKHKVTKELNEDEYFVRTGLESSDIVNRANKQGKTIDVFLYLEMLKAYCEENKFWTADKDPRAIEFLGLLKKVLPKVHVIHVYRDPRDVLASKKKATWSKTGHVWKHVFANRVQFKLGRKLGGKLFGVRYHEICYEELLAAPVKVLTNLCRNLGLDYDDSMRVKFGDAAKKLVSKKEMDWKKETLGPLLTRNSEKWKTNLAYREVKLTELCCKEAMKFGGYENDERPKSLGLLDKLWIQSGRAAIIFATQPYLLYRNLSIKWACWRIL